MGNAVLKLIDLQESLTANFDHILESMAEGLILADENGHLLYVNTKFAEIVGMPIEDILGKKVYQVFHGAGEEPDPELIEKMHKRYQDRLKGISETYELKITRKNGETCWLEISAGPLRNRQGKIVGSIGINTDITRRKELENQLQLSQKMEVVGRLAGGLAHDFNNLLTVISGYANLLKNHFNVGEKGYRHVEAIREASQLASSLTKQLMTVSRRQILQLENVDINKIVRESLGVLQNLIGSSITLNVKLEDDIPLILADVSQVQQVLINLVLNSRDAMKGEGRLSIKTFVTPTKNRDDLIIDGIESELQYVGLSVTDNGCGISEKVRKHLFEPFFTTKKKGSGLGLSTVYGIVGQHNGKVSVKSEEGVFTTFEVFLPVSNIKPQDVIDHHEQRKLKYTGGNESILLVEDEVEVANMIKEVMLEQGYKVIAVNSSLAAAELINSGTIKFDMLISDVIMADLNGFELTSLMLSKNKNIKVLLMSGCVQDLEIPEDLKFIKIPFAQKPFNVEELMYKIRVTLDNQMDCPILAKALLEF